MHLARVTGAVVSTQKSPSLIGKKLLLFFPALTKPSTWQWSALSIRFRAKELKDGNLYPNR